MRCRFTFKTLFFAGLLCMGFSQSSQADEKVNQAVATDSSKSIALAKQFQEKLYHKYPNLKQLPKVDFVWTQTPTNGFSLAPNPNDQEGVTISGHAVSDLIGGYGYWLKHFMHCHWSWSDNRFSPIEKHRVQQPFFIPNQWNYRYAYNYCTLSYTSAFWGEKEWDEELTRMALNGINLVLVQAGLEKVWQLTLRELGYPEEEIFRFIPNPAFAAWWNMGNLEGHGGPISQAMIDKEAELGKFIVQTMRNYGMTPILQGFVGLVPSNLHLYYKTSQDQEIRYIPQGKWCDGFERPAILDPTDPAFKEVARIWYKNLQKVYGNDVEFFGGDLFHEGGKTAGIDIAQAAQNVQNEMLKVNPKSKWVIQSWHGNPSNKLLDALNQDNTLIIALCKDMFKGNQGQTLRYYNGKPWIWTELLNFGGNHGLYGNLDLLANLGDLQKAKGVNELCGIGLISEGTEQNPLFYDLLFDRFWLDKTINLTEEAMKRWLSEYATRRYSCCPPKLLEALLLLEKSVYSPTRPQEGCTESILCAHPGRNVTKASTWSVDDVYYNPTDILHALACFIQAGEELPALQKVETYCYDLVDLTRQFLSDMARPLLDETFNCYDAGKKWEFIYHAEQFLFLIEATNRILSTHPLWHFQRMIDMAKAKATTPEEAEQFVRALKTQATTWSGKIGSLNDYSHRQLGGLMQDYYYPRWATFFEGYVETFNNPQNAQTILQNMEQELRQFEVNWATQSGMTCHTDHVSNQSFETAKRIYVSLNELAARLYQNMNLEGKPWNLQPTSNHIEFDVSGDIMEAGIYRITIKYKKGAHALNIYGVKLYEGTTCVAEDMHEGRADAIHKNNVYVLEVKQLRTSLDAYRLVIEAEGHGGHDSAGEMIIQKIK